MQKLGVARPWQERYSALQNEIPTQETPQVNRDDTVQRNEPVTEGPALRAPPTCSPRGAEPESQEADAGRGGRPAGAAQVWEEEGSLEMGVAVAAPGKSRPSSARGGA